MEKTSQITKLNLQNRFAKKIDLRKLMSKKILLISIAILFIFSFYFFILRDLPLPTKLSSSSTPQSTLIYDRNGKLLYNIYDKKNQSFISLSSISKYTQDATIAIEDKSFY